MALGKPSRGKKIAIAEISIKLSCDFTKKSQQIFGRELLCVIITTHLQPKPYLSRTSNMSRASVEINYTHVFIGTSSSSYPSVWSCHFTSSRQSFQTASHVASRELTDARDWLVLL